MNRSLPSFKARLNLINLRFGSHQTEFENQYLDITASYLVPFGIEYVLRIRRTIYEFVVFCFLLAHGAFDGLLQKKVRNTIANALESRILCIKPSILFVSAQVIWDRTIVPAH